LHNQRRKKSTPSLFIVVHYFHSATGGRRKLSRISQVWASPENWLEPESPAHLVSAGNDLPICILLNFTLKPLNVVADKPIILSSSS